jgi:hypothetical protein
MSTTVRSEEVSTVVLARTRIDVARWTRSFPVPRSMSLDADRTAHRQVVGIRARC